MLLNADVAILLSPILCLLRWHHIQLQFKYFPCSLDEKIFHIFINYCKSLKMQKYKFFHQKFTTDQEDHENITMSNEQNHRY